MNRNELHFERPIDLQATQPAEVRGLQRDEVRLLVSTADGHQHSHFQHLADFLRAGDLLVVNNSATLPASLPAWTSPTPKGNPYSTLLDKPIDLVDPGLAPPSALGKGAGGLGRDTTSPNGYSTLLDKPIDLVDPGLAPPSALGKGAGG